MDPTAALNELRNLAARMLDEDSQEIDTGDALRMAELIEALDGWLTSGGFLPKDWKR